MYSTCVRSHTHTDSCVTIPASLILHCGWGCSQRCQPSNSIICTHTHPQIQTLNSFKREPDHTHHALPINQSSVSRHTRTATAPRPCASSTSEPCQGRVRGYTSSSSEHGECCTVCCIARCTAAGLLPGCLRRLGLHIALSICVHRGSAPTRMKLALRNPLTFHQRSM